VYQSPVSGEWGLSKFRSGQGGGHSTTVNGTRSIEFVQQGRNARAGPRVWRGWQLRPGIRIIVGNNEMDAFLSNGIDVPKWELRHNHLNDRRRP
jgi:hypothetical protein